MIRFFEPEGEPRWPASPAPPDLRLPPLLQFPCGSSASGMRSDAAFPMLSTSNPASHHGGSFGKCTSPNGSSEPRAPGRARTTSAAAERRDSFHHLEPFAPPVPTTAPLNYITGIGGELMSSEPTDPRAAVSRASSQRNAMQETDVEREMVTGPGSKRRKPIAWVEKPRHLPSDEPGPVQTKGRAKRSQKLGDRVTALQQLVSPFGKTDTASVLHEATGYIKALHEQIQLLTDPNHLGIRSSPALQGHGGERVGLRQKGLCLVPISQGIINLSNQAQSDRCTLERMARGPGVHLR